MIRFMRNINLFADSEAKSRSDDVILHVTRPRISREVLCIRVSPQSRGPF